MHTRRSLHILPALILLSGCTLYNGDQPPAPVFGRPTYDPFPTPPDVSPQPEQHQPATDIIETKPLKGSDTLPEMIEIKPEIPPPSEKLNPAPELEQAPIPDLSGSATDPLAGETSSPDPAMPETEPPAEEPQPVDTVKPEPPPVPVVAEKPEPLKPLETFAPQSPAIGSLVMAANENTQSGNLDSAASSIERGIRIEPRNATLYYKLAVLRLKQAKPRLAEDLARKAALLAVEDTALKKHSWLLIAHAREQQNNLAGAKQAELEAAKY